MRHFPLKFQHIEGESDGTMAAQRPYFDKSIVELERLFASAEGDLSLVRRLEDELNHRNTSQYDSRGAKAGLP